MSKTGLSKLEMETIILFNEAEKQAEVFTYNGRMKRKLSELSKAIPDEVKRIKSNGAGGVTYEVPKRIVSLNKPQKKKELTVEQKKELADRLHNTHRK